MTATFGLLLAFFLFVMISVTVAGFLYIRFMPASGGTIHSGVEPGLSSSNESWLSEVLIAAGGLWARTGKGSDPLRKMLFRAGYRSPNAIAAFHGVQLLSCLLFGLTAGWISLLTRHNLGDALIPSLSVAGFGFLLPSRVLEYQVRSRAQRIRAAIPSSLDLLVLAIEAGQSLDQALQETAGTIRPIYPDLSSELVFCNLEMRAGTSRPEALRRLAERSGEEELRKLAVVLIDGERFGTSLGPALRTHSRFLRTRMRQAAQETARKLTVKLVIPVFFLIFPSVLLVTLGPAYLQLHVFLDSFLK